MGNHRQILANGEAEGARRTIDPKCRHHRASDKGGGPDGTAEQFMGVLVSDVIGKIAMRHQLRVKGDVLFLQRSAIAFIPMQ